MLARTTGQSRFPAASVWALSLASLLVVGGDPGRALADEADPGRAGSPDLITRARTTRALTLGFSDAFLGFPASSLRDDNGFVASLRIGVDLPNGNEGRLLRLGLSQQLITERGGFHRVDEGRVYATWLRFHGSSPFQGRTLGWTLGVDVVGNVGGSMMQNWAHQTLFEGRHLSGRGANQLQYQYPRGYQVLGLVGGQASWSYSISGPWFAKGGAEAVVGAGTGLFGELHPFVAIGFATEFVEFELRQGAGIYGTNIGALTIHGGYVTGVLQSQPSVRLSFLGPRWLPSIITFDLQWNRGDTHQHVGGITVGARF
jgi:hypothetical protein